MNSEQDGVFEVEVSLSLREFEALSRMCDQQELTPSQLLRQGISFFTTIAFSQSQSQGLSQG